MDQGTRAVTQTIPKNACRNAALDKLAPFFRGRVEAGLAAAHAAGLQVYVFESIRSVERQRWLYAQGRTRPGPIVTNAAAGYSWHEYGLAVDLVFDGSPSPGIQWDWNGDFIGPKRGDYQQLGHIMQAHGLQWLGAPDSAFFEMPHFQLTGGMTITKARLLAGDGGLRAVWDEVERRLRAAV